MRSLLSFTLVFSTFIMGPIPWSFQFLLWSTISALLQRDSALWICRVILLILIFKPLKYIIYYENNTDLRISRMELIVNVLLCQIMWPDFWLRKCGQLICLWPPLLITHLVTKNLNFHLFCYILNIYSYIYILKSYFQR